MVSVNDWKCMKVRGDYVVSTSNKSGRFPSIDFHSFFRYLATESMGPKQFPVVLFAKAANYCKLTKFRCFKNRTAAHGCEFVFTMLWSLLHLIFEGKMQSFGSNKKYLNIETSTLFWTCLPFSSIFPTWLDKPILDPRSSILASRFPILDSQFSILDSQFSIQYPRSSLPASWFSILDIRTSLHGSR